MADDGYCEVMDRVVGNTVLERRNEAIGFFDVSWRKIESHSEVSTMGLGVGILLVAIGAVLAFAVKVNPTNGAIDIHTIGWILLAVGALGIVLSMVFWSSWAGPGRYTRRTTSVGPGVAPPVAPGETRTTTIDQQ